MVAKIPSSVLPCKMVSSQYTNKYMHLVNCGQAPRKVSSLNLYLYSLSIVFTVHFHLSVQLLGESRKMSGRRTFPKDYISATGDR